MSLENWTRDQYGEYVRWNESPYRQSTGELCLFLPGERPDDVDQAEHMKRIHEYYLLVKRDSARIAGNES